MTAGENMLRVGDPVLWRGSWGHALAQPARVLAIEVTDHPRAKYGEEVTATAWGSYFVATLDNHHWAYADQLEPLS